MDQTGPERRRGQDQGSLRSGCKRGGVERGGKEREKKKGNRKEKGGMGDVGVWREHKLLVLPLTHNR